MADEDEDDEEAAAAAYEVEVSAFMQDVPKGAVRLRAVVRLLHSEKLPQPSEICGAVEELSCGDACAEMEAERCRYWMKYLLHSIDVQVSLPQPSTAEAPARAVCLGVQAGRFGNDPTEQVATTLLATAPPRARVPPSAPTAPQVSILTQLFRRGARLSEEGTNQKDAYSCLSLSSIKPLKLPELEKNVERRFSGGNSGPIDPEELAEARKACEAVKLEIEEEDRSCFQQ